MGSYIFQIWFYYFILLFICMLSKITENKFFIILFYFSELYQIIWQNKKVNLKNEIFWLYFHKWCQPFATVMIVTFYTGMLLYFYICYRLVSQSSVNKRRLKVLPSVLENLTLIGNFYITLYWGFLNPKFDSLTFAKSCH